MKQLLYISFFLFPILSFGQEITVSGKIIYKKSGEPIVSAIVNLNKTQIGTTTDFDGKYSLKANLDDTLVFNYPGMKMQEVKVDKLEINIELEQVEEIKTKIGPAYYPKKKLNNSVKTISEKEIILNSSYKVIKGFVFENAPFINTQIPVIEADILINGSERRTKTDNDGRFEIEVIEGDELVIDGLAIEPKTIIITDKNCYKIYLNNNIVDYPFLYPGKELRKYKRQLRKIEKEVKRKEDNGFYNCYD
ncbi:carboxypeptidase-like regulatory domain-containing protein [Flavobacterium tegetincola]|uniref:carboxypeptidase-like regulatory domain-containing protein n=1 Tax=Flavobacterium tegetincola TaxID=150172 RepID=UPI0009FCE924|nr:carboxypeptidase-like regulatory domain-containing protein [Flavobacterium tegetincola]